MCKRIGTTIGNTHIYTNELQFSIFIFNQSEKLQTAFSRIRNLQVMKNIITIATLLFVQIFAHAKTYTSSTPTVKSYILN
jgi:hypothetical protein